MPNPAIAMQNPSLTSVQNVVGRVVAFIPSLLAGLVVLLLGMLAWWLVAKVVARGLIVLRIDRVLRRVGWGRALAKGDVRHAFFDMLGAVVGGLIFLIFLENVFLIWQLKVLSDLLDALVRLVPNLLISLFIFGIGWLASSMAGRTVRRSLYEAGVTRAVMVAQIVRSAIIVFAAAIALVQLDLAASIVAYAFLITFGALALSFVLAVGLGSRRAVERMWEDMWARRREPGGEPGSKGG